MNDRANKVLNFLRVYHDEKQIMPSLREIGDAVNISSTSVVNYYLDKLAIQGHIKRTRKISRGITLIEKGGVHGKETDLCPVCGRRRRGSTKPSEAFSNTRLPAKPYDPYGQPKRQPRSVQTRSSKPEREAVEKVVA